MIIHHLSETKPSPDFRDELYSIVGLLESKLPIDPNKETNKFHELIP